MSESELSILYRTYTGENDAPRPNWYSKELCLKSLILSADVLKQYGSIDLKVLVDGHLKPHDEWSGVVKKLVEPRGIVVESEPQGNCKSTINAIYQASELPNERMVVIAEDDYLWLAPALVELSHSLRDLPVHYSTPYDHPVRYQPDYPKGADLPHIHNTVYLTAERHWRPQESTCMTFASRAGTIKEDLEYFEKYYDNGKGRPEDRELFREMQGLGGYSYKTLSSPRVLVGPMPSLATHVHLPWLAPLIDWEKEAKMIFEKELK